MIIIETLLRAPLRAEVPPHTHAGDDQDRYLMAAPSPSKDPETLNATATDEQQILPRPCPCCGGRMIIIETLERRCEPKYRPTPTPVTIRIDTS